MLMVALQVRAGAMLCCTLACHCSCGHSTSSRLPAGTGSIRFRVTVVCFAACTPAALVPRHLCVPRPPQVLMRVHSAVMAALRSPPAALPGGELVFQNWDVRHALAQERQKVRGDRERCTWL